MIIQQFPFVTQDTTMAQRNTFMCDEYAHDNSTEYDGIYPHCVLDRNDNPSSLYNGMYCMTGAQVNPIPNSIGFGSCTGIGRSCVEEVSDDDEDDPEPTVIIVKRDELMKKWKEITNALVTPDHEDRFLINLTLEDHIMNRHELHDKLVSNNYGNDIPLETQIRILHKRHQIHL